MQPEQRIVGRVLERPHVASTAGTSGVASTDCPMDPAVHHLSCSRKLIEVPLAEGDRHLVLDLAPHASKARCELMFARFFPEVF